MRRYNSAFPAPRSPPMQIPNDPGSVRALLDQPAPRPRIRSRRRRIASTTTRGASSAARFCPSRPGACPEDCAYCPQSARYNDGSLEREALIDVDEVLAEARAAKDAGASRFCMGAAWREVQRRRRLRGRPVHGARRGRPRHGGVRHARHARTTTRRVACARPGSPRTTTTSTRRSPFTPRSSRPGPTTTDSRTLESVQRAGLSVCCGGILGMGEVARRSRRDALATLAALDPQPESVPVNSLVKVPGTPLADQPDLDPFEVVRVVAAARLLMPRARIRLAAGRRSDERTKRKRFASSPAPTRSFSANVF